MSTRTEQLIAQKQKEIDDLRQNAFTQEVLEVLQNKRHTGEELSHVLRAWLRNYDKQFRQENLKKARAERKAHPEVKEGQPIPA